MEDYSHLEVGSVLITSSDILGVTSAPDGSIYVVGGSCVYLADLVARKAVLYAGGGSDNVEGPRLQVAFHSPHGIGCSQDGTIFVTTTGDHRIYSISNNEVTRFAGTSSGHRDGPRLTAQFHSPQRIVELDGNFYIPDCWNHCVRVISPDGMVSTIGTMSNSYVKGDFDRCSIPYTRGAGVGLNNTIIIASSGPHYITQLDLTTKKMDFIAGSEKSCKDGPSHSACFDFPFDVTVHPVTGDIFVADDDNQRIRRVDAATHDVSTLIFPSNLTSAEYYAQRSQQHTPSLLQDVPISEARAVAPTGICISHHGDLLWTERSGFLRFINHFAPKRLQSTDYLPGFDSYLQTGLFSGAVVEFRGAIFKLNTSILLCWKLPVETLSALLSAPHLSSLSITHVEEFLKTLHGKPPAAFPSSIQPTEATLPYWTSLAHQWFLSSQLFNPNNSISISAQQQLSKLFASAPSKLVIQFIKEIQEQSNFAPAIQIATDSLRFKHRTLVAKKADTEASSNGAETSVPAELTIDKLLDSILGPDSSRDIKVALDSASPAFVPEVPPNILHKAIVPMRDLSLSLKRLAVSIEERFLSCHKADSEMPPNFTFTFTGNSTAVIRAHDWVLYGRWKYFSSLLDSGLSEAADKVAEMPNDFPPEALLLLIQFIYTNKVTKSMRALLEEHSEIAEYLLANGQLYRILEEEDGEERPAPGFSNLISHCQRCTVPAKA